MARNSKNYHLVEAFLKNKMMEEMQTYLSVGRRFKDAPEEDLKRDWVAAFRALIKGNQGVVKDLDDLGAELRFRGVDTPDELVSAEGAEAVRRLKSEGLLDTEAAKQEIGKFLDDLDKPTN